MEHKKLSIRRRRINGQWRPVRYRRHAASILAIHRGFTASRHWRRATWPAKVRPLCSPSRATHVPHPTRNYPIRLPISCTSSVRRQILLEFHEIRSALAGIARPRSPPLVALAGWQPPRRCEQRVNSSRVRGILSEIWDGCTRSLDLLVGFIAGGKAFARSGRWYVYLHRRFGEL
jgi:hypothetical protein